MTAQASSSRHGAGSAPVGPLQTPTRHSPLRHRSLTIILGMSLVTALLPLIVLLPPLSGFDADRLDRQLRQGRCLRAPGPGPQRRRGLAGLLDLGYAAFFAIGAYVYAYGASSFTGLDIPFWLMLPVGASSPPCSASCWGPDPAAARRLPRHRDPRLRRDRAGRLQERGQVDQRHQRNPGLDRPGCRLRRRFGAARAPRRLLPHDGRAHHLVMIILYRLQDSRLGRSWQAIREDELAAASNGINTVTTKLLAFALGASAAGLAASSTPPSSSSCRPTSSCSRCRSPCWPWSSSAASATSGAWPSARSSST